MVKFLKQNSSVNVVKISFYLALFTILVVGAITYKSHKNLTNTTELVMHTYDVNLQLEELLSYLKDAETGQGDFLVTKDSVYLDPYFSSRENINNNFAKLKELTKNDSTQQSNLRALSFTIDRRLNNFSKSYALSKDLDSNETKFRATFLEGKILMDAIRAKIADMITHEDNLLLLRKGQYKDRVALTPIFLFFLLFTSLGLLLLGYNKITKDLEYLKDANTALELFKETTNQSEIIGRHGNWIWNIKNDTYTYSDNLYRLLGEEPFSFEPTLVNFMTFVHPEDLEKLTIAVEKMMVEEYLPFINYRIIRKDGTVRCFKAYGQVIKLSDENQLIGTTTDVTEEVDNLNLLEERNLELTRNNKELMAFNHVASHDLQEPLRKIQTYISRLNDNEKYNLSDNAKTYILRIHDAASRMRLLIDDLLQFSRTNKAEKVLEVSDVNILLEDAKQDLVEVISESNAVIYSDALPEMNVIPFQIKQLFSNLISNSIKYRKEYVSPIIYIKYSKVNIDSEERITKPRKRFYHKITITDNGIGFDNEYAEQIFVLFSRLHNKNEYSGTGIGLSICKKIVDNHNGYILARGNPDKGSVFDVYLPI